MNARALIIALALVACSDRKTPSPSAALPSLPSNPITSVVPKTTKQLVTAIVDSWTATHATMRLWQRTATGWQPVGDAWAGVVGNTGTAWGIGVHGNEVREGPIKKEGDGKSPAGVFAVRSAYGIADDPPKGSKLPYETTKAGDWECVDDPSSEHYAKIVDRKQVASDWDSAEQMLRDDTFHTWVVDLVHNPERKPKAGSCIFLHVWGGPESTTVGCTAMDEKRLADLIAKLDPAANPLFVLLPRAEYQALAGPWGLPPL